MVQKLNSDINTNDRYWIKILRNILSGFGGTAIVLVVNLALMPFVINNLGQVKFGIWVLANSLVGYMGLLDAGLQPMLVKKSSEYLAVDDQAELSNIINTTLLIYTGVGLLAGIFVILLILFLPNIIEISEADYPEFRIVLLLLGFQTALSFPMAIWRGLVGGLQDYHVINIVSVSSNLIKAALTYLLLINGYGLIGLVWLGFAITVLIWGVNYKWVRFRIPNLQLSFSRVKFYKIPELTRFSGSMFIWNIAGQTLNEFDKLIIGIFLPIANITIYEVGFRIFNYSRIILYSMFSILPTASDLSAKEDFRSLRSLYLNGTRYVFLIYSVVVAGLLLLGTDFINLWLGDGYEESVLVMNILLIGSLYQSQNVIAHILLPGMNKLKVFTIIMSSYPVVKIVLAVVLIKQFGLTGIAFATLLTFVLIETIFMYFILKYFEVNLGELLVKVHLPVAITILPVIGITLIFGLETYIHSWFDLLLVASVIIVLFSLSYFVLAISKDERNAIRNFGKLLLSKLEAK